MASPSTRRESSRGRQPIQTNMSYFNTSTPDLTLNFSPSPPEEAPITSRTPVSPSTQYPPSSYNAPRAQSPAFSYNASQPQSPPQAPFLPAQQPPPQPVLQQQQYPYQQQEQYQMRQERPRGRRQYSNSSQIAPTTSIPDEQQQPMPPPRINTGSSTRSSSTPPVARPGINDSNPISAVQPQTAGGLGANLNSADADGKLRRKSWFGGSKEKKKKDAERQPRAWVAGHQGRPPYDTTALVNANRVPELWDETGDTLVHLFPRNSGKGPSFKIHSSLYASSTKLLHLAHGALRSHQQKVSDIKRKPVEHSSRQSSRNESPPRQNGKRVPTDHSSSGSSRHTRSMDDSSDETPRQVNLFLPLTLSTDKAVGDSSLSAEDIDALIAVRNLFAFLVGQSLIATEKRPTIFGIFLTISQFLQAYDFTNLDGSTYGEVAAASFDNYVEELNVGDVRTSREKTIEGIVLGEKMRSVMLFNECFTHAAGKYDDILSVTKEPGPGARFNLLSPITKNRLERASIDLANRKKPINVRLSDFEFPSIFAGVMNSKKADERKVIRFDAWKSQFFNCRRFVIAYYKHKFRSWPPKASSKNELETSGLNRIVLKSLYHDFADMYDLYVDRTALTTRTMGTMPAPETDDEIGDEAIPRLLRRIFDEYDRSSPPVQPPMPFDIPILPNLSLVRPEYGKGDARKDAKLRSKKLKDEELDRLLNLSVNGDAIQVATSGKSPFLAAVRNYERKNARGSTVAEMTDLRAGMWMFMYVVLNALPMLVVDAPGVKWHQGVEYFLCQPPRNGVPWAKSGSDAGAGRGARNWYEITGSSGFVNLPSDLIEHGVEGVYRRSHCWVMAERWSQDASSGRPSYEQVQKRISADSQRQAREKDREQVERQIQQQQQREALPPLQPPPTIADPSGNITSSPRSSRPNSRPSSPGSGLVAPSPHQRSRSRQRESIIALGLEALPLPPGVTPDLPGSRRASQYGLGSAGVATSSPTMGPPPTTATNWSRPVTRDGAEGVRNFSTNTTNTSASNDAASNQQTKKPMTFDDILGGMENKGKKGFRKG